MKTATILLKSIDDVKAFVNLTVRFPYDIDLSSNRYVVDGKSIMGIFSLDLSKPIAVTIHSDDCDDLLNELKAFEC
ncbi:MAG: HPr family phosphocarrier protein [Clostridia bacterium]|nr:HPr family phosphocarrier protein [Clostridia bacterium]